MTRFRRYPIGAKVRHLGDDAVGVVTWVSPHGTWVLFRIKHPQYPWRQVAGTTHPMWLRPAPGVRVIYARWVRRMPR